MKKRLSQEIRELKEYVLVIVLCILLSYSVYLLVDVHTASQLGKEDGVFEYLTALFFLIASIFFLRKFLLDKNVFFVLLAIVFFFGFGEEISWGQRISNFGTPDFLARINVQNEFTFHNIEFFNANRFDRNLKTGVAKLLTINFLFKLFWLGYCILLPIASRQIRFISSLVTRLRVPIPPISIGIFFLVNWLTFRIILSFFLPPNEIPQYYDTVGEIRECVAASIFMILSVYFYNMPRALIIDTGYEEARRELP